MGNNGIFDGLIVTGALDRIGDEAGRLIGESLRAQRLDHSLDVMTTQIGHQSAEFLIGKRIDDLACLRPPEIRQ